MPKFYFPQTNRSIEADTIQEAQRIHAGKKEENKDEDKKAVKSKQSSPSK